MKNVCTRALRASVIGLLALCAVVFSSANFAAPPADSRGGFAAARQDILDLISAYSYTFDEKKVAGWVDLFTADAVWAWYAGPQHIQTIRLDGKQALDDFVRERVAGFVQQGIQSRHFQTNTVFTSFNGDDASAKTLVLVTWQKVGEPGPRPMRTGYYEDKFVRTPDGWKFKERFFYADHE